MDDERVVAVGVLGVLAAADEIRLLIRNCAVSSFGCSIVAKRTLDFFESAS